MQLLPGPLTRLVPAASHLLLAHVPPWMPAVPAALTNDHKALTRQMEVLLHQLHALSSLPGAAAPQPAAAVAARPPPPVASGQHMANGSGSPIAHQAGHSLHQPFAVVDEVTSGSPAAAAGLQLGDQMCSFAGVTQQTAGTLQAVAAALQGNEGRAVEALVLRHGAPLALQLTPQRWGGRGLLGCHLRPL